MEYLEVLDLPVAPLTVLRFPLPGNKYIIAYLEDDENQTIANFCHTHTQCFIIAESSVT